MTEKHTGISNRETAEVEQQERERLRRPDDTARDLAGHVVSESPAEASEAAEDSARPNPDGREGDPRRGIRQSRSGG
ncbi:hypothetical protein TBR22_A27890 [Luteitalea sp. TBR-22]|uniref:hypothetical protein n=1 Tax=Luteitalea sp. TBR-22 TaxID=2802971 RepID=UPI001AF58C26|nr:hypothetical protein [Luteitalea sp. TBR-22]BCS33562.1 hypothetical protein TBR22_A27890 [Luteitalea sp. TBR-22]